MEIWPSLVWLALMVGTLAALPRALQWLRQRNGHTPQAASERVHVLAAAAVGPQQRVVTVQVQGSTLVLGVTAQHITCLHVLPAATERQVSHA